jgi:hypothetical protein
MPDLGHGNWVLNQNKIFLKDKNTTWLKEYNNNLEIYTAFMYLLTISDSKIVLK